MIAFLFLLLLTGQNTLAANKIIEYNHSAAKNEVYYAKELDSLRIAQTAKDETRLSSFSTANQNNRSLNHCKSLVFRTLKSLPAQAVAQIKRLTLQSGTEGRRGWGGGSTIILRCDGLKDEELVSVLVHEMGHVTDTGLLNGNFSSAASEFMDGNVPVYTDDPSLEFYRFSFRDERTLRQGSTELDFVSGYAMSDPFEDFAETYNFYVLHGDEFRRMKAYNTVLQQKYDFLKIVVFRGDEFFNGSSDDTSTFSRNYDTTVLDYDLKKFFVL